jgi:hypothetical protein
MGQSSSKTIFILLGLATVAFGGYYMVSQQAASTPEITESTMQQTLNRTQAFIEYRQTLNQVRFDFSIFEDDRFRVLRSYSEPVEPKPEGRPNPFAPVGNDAGVVSSS